MATPRTHGDMATPGSGNLARELAAEWAREPHAKRGKGRKHRMFIGQWMLKKMGWPEEWFWNGDW